MSFVLDMLHTQERPKEDQPNHMVQLYRQGKISRDLLLLWSISGDLPNWETYRGLSTEEKQAIWEAKMEKRLGPEWRSILELPKVFITKYDFSYWLEEGF